MKQLLTEGKKWAQTNGGVNGYPMKTSRHTNYNRDIIYIRLQLHENWRV
jgi:hypothetical protein